MFSDNQFSKQIKWEEQMPKCYLCVLCSYHTSLNCLHYIINQHKNLVHFMPLSTWMKVKATEHYTQLLSLQVTKCIQNSKRNRAIGTQVKANVSSIFSSIQTECDYIYAWIKKNGHIRKYLTQNGEAQRSSLDHRRRSGVFVCLFVCLIPMSNI